MSGPGGYWPCIRKEREKADITAKEHHEEIRHAVRDLCNRYPGSYWRRIDEERGYPEKFVKALTEAGWLATLIPEKYGGSDCPPKPCSHGIPG